MAGSKTDWVGKRILLAFVSIYVRRNRIKRLFNETLKPKPIVDNVGSEVTGIEREHERCLETLPTITPPRCWLGFQ